MGKAESSLERLRREAGTEGRGQRTADSEASNAEGCQSGIQVWDSRIIP